MDQTLPTTSNTTPTSSPNIQMHTPPIPTTTTSQSPSSAYGVSSRTVRTNWIRFLRDSWRRISRTSKLILGTTFVIGFTQIIITIIMLAIGSNQTCDKPLNIYLIVFVIRLGLSLPLLLYQHLRPSGRNRNATSAIADVTVATTTRPSRQTSSSVPSNRNNAIESSPSSSSSSSSSSSPSSSIICEETARRQSSRAASTQQQQEQQQQQQQHRSENTSMDTRPTMIRSFLDRVKSLLDLISILWFVVGNYLIFTASDQCHRDARYLFYTTLTWILLGYFLVLIPLLLCATVVFCLPCLLVAMRAMNVDYATGMVGANKSEIQEIPVYKYKPSPTTDHCEIDQRQTSSSSSAPSVSSSSLSSPSSSSTPHFSTKMKKRFVPRLFSLRPKRNQDQDEESTYEDLTMDPNDATCTICLSDYETDDFICKLRCKHHFHRDCVHEWLALNYKCPLCQRDFRRKKTEQEEQEV
ncbi:uncharacterized protein BX664DRAFT_329445 [Halteromyces radiatus]|uniref:uncharacterized protein n=1 Tax=Halteromyces radiatus TaxID=101107 RepID=UPI00221F0612|nr:uncharacterized protein BX664DRAFT_329445 [Halteromyces radiatus]KAI8093324.1 hypothetical protein BX664DRAFT_329445 [Halteromyces radiatus]